MRGTATQLELVQRTRAAQMTHLALTEINGLWGFINFVRTARENNIQPIAGSNLVNEYEDVILLAESQTGYENICFIISEQHKNPDGGILEWAEPYTKEVFFISPKEGTLKALVDIVPSSHLFVELRPGMQETTTHELAQKYRLEMVVTGDVYFLNKSDVQTHRVLRAIDKNTTLSQLKEEDFKNDEHYFRTEKELINLFPNSLAAINNSQYLADRCKTDWNYINTIFPAMSLKDTHRANHKLRKMVYAGAQRRYETVTETVKKRIEYELSIIIPKGFSPYFLVVADIVKQTKATIGRGSGAASIISYCLEITQVDPIKYNLQFERFIHPQRVDMPDIDIDFPWDERDEIFDYVFRKYGDERVAAVSNQVFIQPRSAVREVSKVYGLSNEEIKSVTKRMGYFSKKNNLLEWIQSDKRFENVDLNETLRSILKQSEKVIGAFHMSSVHCGGLIITPNDIRKYVPVLKAPKGIQIVEWEKDQVEDSGLLKIDILGNRSLAVVRDTLKQLGDYRNKYMDYHSIVSIGDPKTQTLIETGKTMGIFYIESPAMRLLLKKARKVDFEHVVIYSSIIRPAANRFIDLMVERIHGKSWKLLHPDLTCLSESYGIMVYEEQVSMVARDIAGFTYEESDYVRKVISRPHLKHFVPQWRDKFIKGTVKRGYTKELALTLWEMIQSFSGYSFCKPHSASFAMLSFTCAYLKAHFPAEFLAAVISNQGGYYSSFAYFSETKRWGITILKPDINLSNYEHKGRKNKIRMGFMAINELQLKSVKNILKVREEGNFKSLTDFVQRTDIDFSDAVALTNAGGFNSLESNLTHQEIAYKIAYAYSQNSVKHKKGGADLSQGKTSPKSSPIRKRLEGESRQPISPVSLPEKIPIRAQKLSREQLRKMEIDSFGYPISWHPLEEYLPALGKSVQKGRDIPKFSGKSITLAGYYITRKPTITRKNEPMAFVTFEDETDIYECVMFPKVYTKFSDLLNWEKLFIVQGKVDEAFGTFTIAIEKLVSLKRWGNGDRG